MLPYFQHDTSSLKCIRAQYSAMTAEETEPIDASLEAEEKTGPQAGVYCLFDDLQSDTKVDSHGNQISTIHKHSTQRKCHSKGDNFISAFDPVT